MSRLNGMRTYLAGAMDRVSDGGVGWRRKITPQLRALGVTVLDPCDKPAEVVREDDKTRSNIQAFKIREEYDRIREDYAVIRTLDLRCVDVSDFIIASIDINVHACGTYEEICCKQSEETNFNLVPARQGERPKLAVFYATSPTYFWVYQRFARVSLSG